MEDDLKQKVADFGMNDKVVFCGWDNNPFRYVSRSNCFVLSSDVEGFPNVLIEALACGCPVVSTDCPSGPSEILNAGAYGRLVPCRDPEAMAKAILLTLDEPPDRQLLRDRAQAFSIDSAVERYARLFEACLQNRAPAPVMTVGTNLVRPTMMD